MKTILNLPTCWEQISAFSKSQKIDSFDQYYTKRKSDYINLQIISREWKYYMVALMNFKLFDRYGGYRVLMFKFNHFNPAGLFSPNNLVLAVTLGLLGGVFRNYSVDSFFWIRSNNSVSDVHHSFLEISPREQWDNPRIWDQNIEIWIWFFGPFPADSQIPEYIPKNTKYIVRTNYV